MPLPTGDVLRQRKWGEDVVSAVEIRELLAGEHVGDGGRALAQLERVAFRVTDGRPDLDTVWLIGQLVQRS